MQTLPGTQPSLFGHDLRTDQLQLFNAMADRRQKAKPISAPSLLENIADDIESRQQSRIALRGQSRLF